MSCYSPHMKFSPDSIPGANSRSYRESGDLTQLSSDGHFLKGSSATLGLTKVKDSCEKIQHYGARKDESGNPSNLSAEECLRRIGAILKDVKEEYKDAERVLKHFYHNSS